VNNRKSTSTHRGKTGSKIANKKPKEIEELFESTRNFYKKRAGYKDN